jgi:hypothetical protein
MVFEKERVDVFQLLDFEALEIFEDVFVLNCLRGRKVKVGLSLAFGGVTVG